MGGGGGNPEKPIPFPKSQNGFFNVVFFWVFLGLNLKNDIIILILYLKSEDSATEK